MDPGLFKAAKSGNICVLKQILNENPGLLTKLSPQENTPLHVAVQFGHIIAVAEVFYRCRSHLERPNINGDTPLHVAARYGHLHIIEFLVKEALTTSRVDFGHEKSSKFDLLRQENKENNTILHEACRNGHVAVVELLLKIDPELACFENHVGESPLFLAAVEGTVDIVNQILISNLSSSHGGPDGQTALHAAVMERHSDITQVILKAKPHLVTQADYHSRTPLYYAASLGDHKTVQRLLELDPSVAYVSDKNGHSPLHIAAQKGHINAIEQIIFYCPDSGELLDQNGRNALHSAVFGERANVVKYMLRIAELEGLINEADYDGNTPLHMAAIGRESWILRYLMWDSRVNRRAKNKNGETVFDIDKSIQESCIAYPENTMKKLGSRFTYIAKNQEPTDTMQAHNYWQTGQTLLMVATLLTTVTFTAAFTMPGGFDSKGQAVLQSSKQLKFFIISDSIAMACSITAACIIFWGAIGSNESYVYYFVSASVLTYVALITAGMAFSSGIKAVMPDQQYFVKIATSVGMVFHVSTFFLFLKLVRIFPFSETCQFLNFHLRKIKLNLKKRIC